MKQRLAALVTFCLAALPVVLSAQEHEAGGGGLSPFSGNVGNALWTLVVFVLVVMILGKFAWGPILAQLKARESFIHDALSSAKQQNESAEATLKEYTEKLRAARLEADSIIAQSRSDAERLREEMRVKAKAEAETIVANAERQIQLETNRALQQIRHEAVDLSMMIASKLIQKNLSKEDNERLIDEALRQVEGKNLRSTM
jgi:F-type H+-transporting ATPase subunit b